MKQSEIKQFKTLSTHRPVELIQYVKDYLAEKPETEILLGCDSQNRGRETYYAVVVGLYTKGKGAHVLYSRFTVPRIKDDIHRLLNEIWYSVEVAEQFKDQLGIRPTTLDIDINPDPKYRSNQALSSAVGIITGMGYKVRHKGNSPMMTYASDKLVK